MTPSSLAGELLRLERSERLAAIAEMSAEQLLLLQPHWRLWAHPGQVPPAQGWHTWLIMAGRGYGKTRAGAEWCARSRKPTRPRGSRSSALRSAKCGG
jgi:phage terminase large subunit-like protein